jgi:hypothetical protein
VEFSYIPGKSRAPRSGDSISGSGACAGVTPVILADYERKLERLHAVIEQDFQEGDAALADKISMLTTAGIIRGNGPPKSNPVTQEALRL